MSKEKAEKFLADVNTNTSLQKKLLDAAANAKAWIAEAATAGYEMTADELRAAAEHVVGKPVTADNLIGTLRGLFEGELKDENLEAVTGGANVGQVRAPAQAAHLNVATVQGLANPGSAAADGFAREASPIRVGGSIANNPALKGGREGG
jgi:predicted ribosomally synthesized peptide with nif11-like leader